MPGRTIRIHYLRPPDRVEVFTQEVVHEDDQVSITLARSMALRSPLTIEGETALDDGSDVVWFTFPGAWHDIGRFHLPDGTLTGIYANILTPCRFLGDTWHTTDLFLDLWIPARDGRIPASDEESEAGRPLVRLLDEPELKSAEEAGWITADQARMARAEAARLLRAASRGAWPPPIVNAWPLARARRTVERSSS
jgi:predicted RNA-binding protein associated with RNAse of E/G family